MRLILELIDLTSELELKQAKATEFIRSKEFGIATWSTLFIVQRAVYTMANAIKAESLLARQLETFSSVLPEQLSEREELRDFLQLDVISKVMMLIETISALSDALLANMYEVPMRMTFYRPGTVSRLLYELNESNGRAHVAKILALPDPSSLPVGDREKTAFATLSDRTCDTFLGCLRAWADFYYNHSIAYNKLKHGLSLSTGLHPKDENGVEVKDISLSFAYDRVGKRRRKTPSNSLLVRGQLLDGSWFDTVNIIPYSEENLILYTNMAAEIYDWISYIVDNQLTRAENSGGVYLPGRLSLRERSYQVSYRCKEFQGARANLRSAFHKIVKLMYINQNRTHGMSFVFGIDRSVPKLLSSFSVWHSATVSASPDYETAPSVVSEVRRPSSIQMTWQIPTT